MSSASWMVAVMTLAAAGFLVWLELHCRRNQRQKREGTGAQNPAAEPSKRDSAQ